MTQDSRVCSRDWEFPSSLSPSAEPPGPDLCFLLRAGENTQPSMLTQHQCHPGDSWRTRSVTRDWLLCLGMATSHLMATLNAEGSSKTRAMLGWCGFFADGTGLPVDGMGRWLVHEDSQDPWGGRLSPDVGTQKQETWVALMPHAHEQAGCIALHSAGSCSAHGWPGPA